MMAEVITMPQLSDDEFLIFDEVGEPSLPSCRDKPSTAQATDNTAHVVLQLMRELEVQKRKIARLEEQVNLISARLGLS